MRRVLYNYDIYMSVQFSLIPMKRRHCRCLGPLYNFRSETMVIICVEEARIWPCSA